jgi:hypothetical protein
MSDEDEKVVPRAEEVLPVDGSEDVSHLLRSSSLPGLPDDEAAPEDDDENAGACRRRRQSGSSRWSSKAGPRLNPHHVTEEFDQAWREKFGGS